MAGDAVGGHERVRLSAEDFSDLGRRLDEELAFLAFAVGILRRIEAAGRIEHFSHDVVQEFLRDCAEELVSRYLPGVAEAAGNLRCRRASSQSGVHNPIRLGCY